MVTSVKALALDQDDTTHFHSGLGGGRAQPAAVTESEGPILAGIWGQGKIVCRTGKSDKERMREELEMGE